MTLNSGLPSPAFTPWPSRAAIYTKATMPKIKHRLRSSYSTWSLPVTHDDSSRGVGGFNGAMGGNTGSLGMSAVVSSSSGDCLVLSQMDGFELEIPSVCGYDEKAKQQRQNGKDVESSKSWSRRVPYDFTGCLAHVEITERLSDGDITRITGCFDHNDACIGSVIKRIPSVPLHEHVYEVALEQLSNGARHAPFFCPVCKG